MSGSRSAAVRKAWTTRKSGGVSKAVSSHVAGFGRRYGSRSIVAPKTAGQKAHVKKAQAAIGRLFKEYKSGEISHSRFAQASATHRSKIRRGGRLF